MNYKQQRHICILILVFLMLPFYISAQTTINDGTIYSTSTTWTLANSPYIIQGKVKVDDGATLTIEPGVTVKFKTGSDFYHSSLDCGFLRIDGKLVADGNENELITFTRDGDSENWSVILFNSADEASSFSYCKVEYGYKLSSFNSNNFKGVLAFYQTEGVHVENCTFTHNEEYAIYLVDVPSSNFTNNVITDNKYGIFLDNSSSQISENTISNNEQYAIDCRYSSSPTIENNTINDNNNSGIYCYMASPSIVGNIIENNAINDYRGGGIYCGESTAVIRNNRILNNYENGIECNSSSSIDIINNLIDNSADNGIVCKAYSTVSVSANTIVNNQNDGITLWSGADVTVTNTILWENESSVYLDNWSSPIPSLSITYSCIQEYHTGAGNTTSDPEFVDAANDNYSLMSTSPCINTGTPDTTGLLLSSTDLTGNARISNDTIDIGAYEYQQDELPLPVSLAFMEATCLNGSVRVSWQTASEIENRAFRLYRNNDLITEMAGAGTTTEEQTYLFTDTHVVPGRTYTYVLAEVSMGNKEVRYADEAVTVRIDEGQIAKNYVIGTSYPNPFNPSCIVPLTLTESNDVEAVLYDVQGRCIRELYNGFLMAGSHDLKIDGAELAAGVYILTIRINEARHRQKIVLMK